MNNTINIINYLIKEKGLKQFEIAEKLNVKDAQISKWKLGVNIPKDREVELMKLAGIYWERDDGSSPLLSWAVKVRNQENENSWYEFFKTCLEKVDRYSIASSLASNQKLTTSFLGTLNNSGLFMPESIEWHFNHPEGEWDQYQGFIEHTYLGTYFELENWCCQNLNLKKEYMQDFFLLLPQFTMYKLIIEEIIELPMIEDPYALNTFEQNTTMDVWGLREQIEKSIRYEGLDFNIEELDGLIKTPDKKKNKPNSDPFSGPKEENISHLFDEYPDLLIRNNYDIVDGKVVTAENNNGVDINLSYGERKILRAIKDNQKLINKVLKKLEKL